MNLHEMPAFIQNFSIKLTCSVHEPVTILYVLQLSLKVKKMQKIFFFHKIAFFLCVIVYVQDVTA